MKIASLLRRLPLAPMIIVVGILGVVVLLNLKPRPEPRPEPEPPKPVVDVARVKLEKRALSVETQGVVEPRRDIQLLSQLRGQVVEVAPEFVNGGSFSRGDLLLRLDPRDYEYALARAESQLRDAEQLLAEERGRSRQAKREWQDLGNEDANDLFLRKPQLAAAEAAVEAARAERDQARLDLERTEVRAPFDGRIRQIHADLGQHLSPGSQIADIYDDSVARIRLPLTGSQAALLELPLAQRLSDDTGSTVTFIGRVNGQTHEWTGVVKRTEASLDAQSRMLYVVAEVKDPFNLDLHPAPMLIGLFVDAQIEGRELDSIVSLPRASIFRRNLLYSLTADNEVQEKQVTVLKYDGDRVWVRGDLSEEEAVIVDRQNYVSPGIAVAIQGSEGPADTMAADQIPTDEAEQSEG